MTAKYYDEHSEDFYNATVDVDMSDLYSEFLQAIPVGSRILDLGCGSGRDTKNFSDKGYEVHAIDASSEMVRLASLKSGVEVVQTTFDCYSPSLTFDGIWACASLLHVAPKNLPELFTKVSKWLKPTGILFVSFKYGNDVRYENGRTFTDVNEEGLKLYLTESGLVVKKNWTTEDKRPQKTSKWLNAIITK